ncbi:PadR family transcriptional regulator [Streptomyces sp. TRM 70351]|uniref:PadR family transcriptional regulator n=1 Tax=Streptomyces sp. TRM 70351 TaxID=3116552 RepID=UPI002E7BB214|nr:PadR family transcriptional regulator [Streptomyces sp. TRM 70351]MEE1927626.1 PadR family transcriptional regulator [Streptomyces sp. TRM 70351]
MPPVFAHGRLRLYLLKLLDEAPRHGYEVIRLLEERFEGLYAPSAGTVYPRLAKLEAEGLVSHTTEGGRKVYSITGRGRAELADRAEELAELEQEIHASLTALAAEIRDDVRGSASDLRRELREAAQHTRGTAGGEPGGGNDPWREAGRQWQEQARRAKAETRRARQQSRAAQEEARRARQEAQRVAQEEVRRIARQVQEQVTARAQSGDWQGAVREGVSELSRELGALGRMTARTSPWPSPSGPGRDPGAAAQDAGDSAREEPGVPDWAAEPDERADEDPARALRHLLDRFRDDVRDAARDHGVSSEQLREVRRHLSTAAAHIGATLRPPA